MQSVSKVLSGSRSVSRPLAVVSTRGRSSEAAPAEKEVKKEKSMRKPAVHSKSFVQNMFRGIVEPAQAFPFPKVLNEEQKETLEVLVPMAEKFFYEVNDPLVNDALEKVPDENIEVFISITIYE